jgi:hypothetical protein
VHPTPEWQRHWVRYLLIGATIPFAIVLGPTGTILVRTGIVMVELAMLAFFLFRPATSAWFRNAGVTGDEPAVPTFSR